MRFTPHTDAERQAMLDVIGVSTIDQLFADVPEHVRFPDLDLPKALSELEVAREMRTLSTRNLEVDEASSFLGAGAYRHFRPAIVDSILQRGEFFSAYTPYQPELSQGMLQAMFEYQSMICRLTGMEISNASHYDGATSLAEAVLLALDATGRDQTKVLLSRSINPHYRDVVETYLQGTDAELDGEDELGIDLEDLLSKLDRQTAAVVVQSPNFLGQFEALEGVADRVHQVGALLIVVTDPIALGLFRPPGADGADVVVADGQPLGIPVNFGGPHLGIFATRQAHVRRLIGRLVGETVDGDGERGYVLTLATREQHIRRAKATSNICTNAALSALAATVYLAGMGKQGMRAVAERCYHQSHYAASEISRAAGVPVNPQAPAKPFFKEFVVELPHPVSDVKRRLRDRFGIVGGYDLGRSFPGLERHMLIAVTEANSKTEIDRLASALGAICRGDANG
ncbi:MAG: aminomethyl-transferring glycine dehydrogenase subunit GcvPA [Geminicoccaceae bacterium]